MKQSSKSAFTNDVWKNIYKKPKKPIMWWWHKIWAEFWYWFEINIYLFLYNRYKIELYLPKWCNYYYHLNIMLDNYGINLYGERVYKKTYQQQWQEDYDNSITIEEFQSLPDNEKRGKIVRI